jgi:hypothetical protein
MNYYDGDNDNAPEAIENEWQNMMHMMGVTSQASF